MPLITYQEVIKSLNKKKREKHLLLGNGFSQAYDSKIFSYNALSDFVAETEDELLQKLFNVINTTNFETVMSHLDIFYKLALEFLEDKKLAKKILKAKGSLKDNLINAISELHPEHVFKIPEKASRKCATFLGEYLYNGGNVFTTNYDLLLYWVLMKNKDELENICDGFGKEYIEKDEYDPDFESEFGDLEWGPNQADQHIYYVHGALHIFDTGVSIEKEIYEEDYLLTNIKKRIDKKEYPVFVTAGDGKQKLAHILHNPYLDYCYKQLSTITGSLVAFGFGFGKYDSHIVEAINKAAKQKKDRLWSIYIGVYSKKDEKYITSIASKLKCKKVYLFDSKTASIW
ncbi:MAG: DUF4917 family protein [Candidatus Omnitrophica bacterium]|nr:DUF4917 family protein [Candidatus Omnitrophota bacterium]